MFIPSPFLQQKDNDSLIPTAREPWNRIIMRTLCNVTTSILPLPPQEQSPLPRQRPSQSNKKLKQKQVIKENNDQEMRRPRNDLILMPYVHLLPILINVGEIMPKHIEPARFPNHHKHDPNATFGYHAGYVEHSTEACYVPKNKVQELLDQKLLCITYYPQE
ncbi:hypothetical protein KIW84_071960 [Lathyrus oleraceus]|uniref:Uncharacterized protein n=1 Tax=Pisum sativum TaxID=3888 RepID=A0A9D4VM42_PEA|nr:hypothetical protein KIW84_071960 [Pisum sativum]